GLRYNGETSLPARRPSAGAVPGRWGACLAVRTPPAAFVLSLARRLLFVGNACLGSAPEGRDVLPELSAEFLVRLGQLRHQRFIAQADQVRVALPSLHLFLDRAKIGGRALLNPTGADAQSRAKPVQSLLAPA